jgi:hypothetical protein
MRSKVLMTVAAFLLTGAATLPASAQTPAPESTQPEMTAPQVTAPHTAEPEATASESDAGPSHRLTSAAVVFNLIDRDSDGEIDLQEASALFEAIFTTLDADENGKLSKDEINSALQRMHGGGREERGYDRHHGGHRHR